MDWIYYLSWIVFGMIIGGVASEIRKFPLWQGILGGAFFGILSPLMFLISSTKKKCKYCMSQIPKEATVCSKCGREQGDSDSTSKNEPPPVEQKKQINIEWIVVGIICAAIVVAIIITVIIFS